jgi:D-psicose/D-tagatose/L-ribulose 3-epimerase
MRFGCCVNMVTKSPDVSGVDVLPDMQRIGFDYAELSLSHLCMLEEKAFLHLKEKLVQFQIQAEACNNFFPPFIRLTGGNVNHKEINQYLVSAINKARELGICIIVFGSGPARMVPDNFPGALAFEQLVNLLREINGFASQEGITIAIEPLRMEECNIINTYRESLSLAMAVNEPYVKCLLDFYHLNEEKEDLRIINENRDMLAHVHFSEPQGRRFPINDNALKYTDYIGQLKSAGYKGRVSIEAYTDNFTNDAVEALKLLRNIDKNLMNNLTQK